MTYRSGSPCAAVLHGSPFRLSCLLGSHNLSSVKFQSGCSSRLSHLLEGKCLLCSSYSYSSPLKGEFQVLSPLSPLSGLHFLVPFLDANRFIFSMVIISSS